MRPLTKRQLDILRLIALGWQDKHIAYELGLEVDTIKVYVSHLRTRLPKAPDERVGRRAYIMLYALQHPEILTGGGNDNTREHS